MTVDVSVHIWVTNKQLETSHSTILEQSLSAVLMTDTVSSGTQKLVGLNHSFSLSRLLYADFFIFSFKQRMCMYILFRPAPPFN